MNQRAQELHLTQRGPQAIDRLRNEAIVRPRPASLGFNQAGIAQDAKMVRDRRLRELERGREVANANLFESAESVDDRDARRVGKCFECCGQI